MDGWIRKETETVTQVTERNGVVLLTFPALDRLGMVRAGFSTRHGGVSTGHLAEMNFSFGQGEPKEVVRENYRRAASALGVEPESFVLSHQTHTVNLMMVREEDRGTGVFRERTYDDIDGLLTNARGVTLTTFHADCLPVYLADQVHGAIALLHAGWRGTIGQITGHAVRRMGEEFGTRPKDLTAVVGPGICRECYEIGEDVAERFRSALSAEEAAQVLTDPHRKEDGMHWQLDLGAANRIFLQHAGIPAEKIHVSGVCTRCNASHLHSYRAAGPLSGRNAAFLSLI